MKNPRLRWGFCDDPSAARQDYLRMHYWDAEDRTVCGRFCMPCGDWHENPSEPCPDCRRIVDAAANDQVPA